MKPAHPLCRTLMVECLIDFLPSETQAFDNRPVPFHILVLDVIKESAPLADQHQQTPSGMVILLVDLKMFGQIGNAMR
jgi:hypothetical protein